MEARVTLRETLAGRAFTLVELLVAIGILAVLLGLLIPAICGIRASARAARCAAQLRQVDILCNLYATNWKDRIPNNSYAIGDDTAPLVQALGPGTPAAIKAASRGMLSTSNLQWFDAVAISNGWHGGRSVAARAAAGQADDFRRATQYLWCPDVAQEQLDPNTFATNYGIPSNVSSIFNFQSRRPKPGEGPLDFFDRGRILTGTGTEVVLLSEGSAYEDNSEAYNLTNAAVGNVMRVNQNATTPKVKHRGINYLFSDGRVERLPKPPHSFGSVFGDFTTLDGTSYTITSTDESAFRRRVLR